ncbi:MAG: FadR family transcriptional regulator [Deltaproteobacteria bacterium]|nr:FadR family transcriptional regulator [Deltaproteobacteria bacterium]
MPSTSTSEFLRPARRIKISDDIYHQILSYISKADLKPGHKLPSERELSELFSTGRSAVREALRFLEALQIVEVYQGKGYFVKKFDYDAYIQFLSLSISMKQGSNSFSLSEFWEARKMLESRLCAMAARRMDTAKCSELQKIHRKMHESLGEPDYFARSATMFHREIAKIAGNKVLLFLLDCLLTIRPHVRKKAMSRPQFRFEVLRSHKNIIDCFLKNDPAGAGKAMKQHLDSVDQFYTCAMGTFNSGP